MSPRLTRLMEIERPVLRKPWTLMLQQSWCFIWTALDQWTHRFSKKPATMCVDTIAYLRDALLFEGVIISDCMETGAIVKEHRIEEVAVQAGSCWH